MEVNCEVCNTSFYKRPSKAKLYKHHYCSQKCRANALRKPLVEVTCSWCGAKVFRKRKVYEKHDKFFCNHSCTGQYNGAQKRKHTKCNSCGNQFPRMGNSRICPQCKENRVVLENLTLEELMRSRKLTLRQQLHNAIRTMARRMKYRSTTCERCPYTKHVQVAHKKAIKDFPLTAKISEVNCHENFLYLCPNCHWEYDNLEN